MVYNYHIHGIVSARGLLYIRAADWVCGVNSNPGGGCEYCTFCGFIEPASGVCTRLEAVTDVTGNFPPQTWDSTGAGFDTWNGKLYVFGGGQTRLANGVFQTLDDLHEFDPVAKVWQHLDRSAGVTGTAPSVRAEMGFSAGDGSLFVTLGTVVLPVVGIPTTGGCSSLEV